MKPVESRMPVLISLVLFVILTVVAPVIPAAAATTSLERPVEGEVITPDGPCHEHVPIAGRAVVVADVRPDSEVVEITVHINLADVQGTGETTGATYLATGAVQMDFATPSLPTTVQGVATFAWMPLGPCRLPRPQAETLSVPVELALDAAGRITPNGRVLVAGGQGTSSGPSVGDQLP